MSTNEGIMFRQQEWYEGYDAYHMGDDLTDNPYEPGSIEAECWDDGWEDAQEDEYQGDE